jgi:CRP-like cAMP-binding protein
MSSPQKLFESLSLTGKNVVLSNLISDDIIIHNNNNSGHRNSLSVNRPSSASGHRLNQSSNPLDFSPRSRGSSRGQQQNSNHNSGASSPVNTNSGAPNIGFRNSNSMLEHSPKSPHVFLADPSLSNFALNQPSLEELELKGEKGFTVVGKALTKIPFFFDLDLKSMKKLHNHFDRKTYFAKDYILKQGDEANGAFHVIVRGSVRITAANVPGSPGRAEHKEIELAVLEKGESFGANSLVAELTIEPVTVQCLEECIILSISRQKFQDFAEQNESVRVQLFPNTNNIINSATAHQSTSNSPSDTPSSAARPLSAAAQRRSSAISVQLKEIPFFQEISELKLQQLATLFEFRRCSSGEIICKQGDQSNGFYIIVQGRINVSASGPGGTGVHLNTLTAGDVFGEIALIQNTVRTATLTTIQPCVLLYLSAQRFQTFLNLAPEIRHSALFNSTIVRRTANSLKTIPLFAFLRKKEIGPLSTFDESKLALLGELFRFQQYSSNSIIFKEGDEADAFYIIHRGTVVVTASSADSGEEEANQISVANLLLNEQDKISGGAQHNTFLEEEKSGQEGEERKANSNLLNVPAAASASRSGDSDSDSESVNNFMNSPSTVVLTELTKNDWFGEIGLINNTRRTATVITTTPCVMLKLARKNFESFLTIVPEVKHALDRVMSVRTAQTLSNIPFFRAMKENKPWSKLGILGSMFQFEHFTAGEIVVKEGEIGDKFFVIVDGKAEVTKMVHNGGKDEIVVLDQLSKNAYFGELSLLSSSIRTATVTCKEDCLFLTVTKEKFNKFLQIAPDIVDHFSSLVTHRTANLLRSIDFFVNNIKENKPWSKLELLCSMFNYEYMPENTILMKKGDQANDSNKFYIISVGSVSAQENDNSPVKTMNKGDFFGELSLLYSSPRSMTIKTREACVFFTLSREKFEQFLRVCPEIKPQLAARYPNSNINSTSSSYHPAEEMSSVSAAALSLAAAPSPSPSSADSEAHHITFHDDSTI